MFLVLIQLTALATFTVYASLAYIEGQQLASTVLREYGHLAITVNEQYSSAKTLQSLIDGELRVAGRTYTSAFVGDVPSVLPHAQVCQILVRLPTCNAVCHMGLRRPF